LTSLETALIATAPEYSRTVHVSVLLFAAARHDGDQQQGREKRAGDERWEFMDVAALAGPYAVLLQQDSVVRR
jgi:hypothetical protein